MNIRKTVSILKAENQLVTETLAVLVVTMVSGLIKQIILALTASLVISVHRLWIYQKIALANWELSSRSREKRNVKSVCKAATVRRKD